MLSQLDRELGDLGRCSHHPERDVDGARVHGRAVHLRTHRIDKGQIGLRVLLDELEAFQPERMRAFQGSRRAIPVLGGKARRLLDQRCGRGDDRTAR